MLDTSQLRYVPLRDLGNSQSVDDQHFVCDFFAGSLSTALLIEAVDESIEKQSPAGDRKVQVPHATRVRLLQSPPKLVLELDRADKMSPFAQLTHLLASTVSDAREASDSAR
jgi:hypothetical protein